MRRARSIERACSAALVAIAAMVAVGCGSSLANLPREGDLHPRLTRYAYIEEGKLVSFIVDTEATRRREGAAFVPVGIGVANLGLYYLTLNRESFTLVDDEGHRYSMATTREVRALGGSTVQDLSLSRSFASVFGSRFDVYPFVRSAFYPVGLSDPNSNTRGLVRDRVQLSRFSWTTDVIYFPHPEGGLLGRRFELWLDAEELKEPVFVKFRVR